MCAVEALQIGIRYAVRLGREPVVGDEAAQQAVRLVLLLPVRRVVPAPVPPPRGRGCDTATAGEDVLPVARRVVGVRREDTAETDDGDRCEGRVGHG